MLYKTRGKPFGNPLVFMLSAKKLRKASSKALIFRQSKSVLYGKMCALHYVHLVFFSVFCRRNTVILLKCAAKHTWVGVSAPCGNVKDRVSGACQQFPCAIPSQTLDVLFRRCRQVCLEELAEIDLADMELGCKPRVWKLGISYLIFNQSDHPF